MDDAERGQLTPAEDFGNDAEALRQRMAQDGYLLMQRLLPADEVSAVRLDILRICSRAGWLIPDREDDDEVDVKATCEPPDPRYRQVYEEVIGLESFNRLAHAEPLVALVSALLDDGDVIPRPAKLARLVFPQRDTDATPPHQDFPHEQGTENAYTAWIPLGSILKELGGLGVWPGSHLNGLFEHGYVPGTGGLGIRFEDTPVWHTGDFAIGDVLVFHSMTVHRAMPNRTVDRIRLSADFRYQRVSDPMTPHMLQPSGGRVTWEQMYAGWEGEELRFYWAPCKIVTVPYDYSFYERRDDQVMTDARNGDRDAIAFLRTISSRNPDPAKRQQARALLTDLEGLSR